MSRSPSKRTFTVQQANAALPLIRAIVSDLVHLSKEVLERRQRLAMLFDGRRRDSSDPYRQELAQIEEELDKDSQRLREFVDELVQLGVEPQSATEGLVDFPSLIDGRRVYLCWKLGENEVLFWHELDAGYQGRQPLAAGSIATGRLPSGGSIA